MIGPASESHVSELGTFRHVHALRRQPPTDPGATIEDRLETGNYLPEPTRFQVQGTHHPVRGHLLSDANHLKYPSTHYEIRAFQKHGEEIQVLDVRDLTASMKPFQRSLSWTVTGSEIDQHYEHKSVSREQRLAQEQPQTLKRILPKDHGLLVNRMEIMAGDSGDPSDQYFRQLTEVGAVEGFHVVGYTGSGRAESLNQELTQAGYRNYTLLESARMCTWLEDYGEPTVNGGRLNPPDLGTHYPDVIEEAMTEGRRQRLEPLGLSEDFSRQGGVEYGEYQKVSVAQGMLQGQHTETTIGYVEYGNLAAGVREDGTPYVLVGKDSVEITRRMLEKDRGREVSTEEALQVLAADHGVKPDQLFGIEQPGEFHIDMRMMPVGPGHIALQDSRKAAALNCAWLDRELEESGGADEESRTELEQRKQKLREWGEEMARYEDVTAKDLEAAGLKVSRVAGAFPDLGSSRDTDLANFFNGRHGTNERGERYSILMGSTPQAEEYFVRLLFEELKAPIDRVYFLDAEQTQETLELQGGLKCRTKSLGHLAVADPADSVLSRENVKKAQPGAFQVPIWGDF